MYPTALDALILRAQHPGVASLTDAPSGPQLGDIDLTVEEIAAVFAVLATTLADLRDVDITLGPISESDIMFGGDGRPVIANLSRVAAVDRASESEADDVRHLGDMLAATLRRCCPAVLTCPPPRHWPWRRRPQSLAENLGRWTAAATSGAPTLRQLADGLAHRDARLPRPSTADPRPVVDAALDAPHDPGTRHAAEAPEGLDVPHAPEAPDAPQALDATQAPEGNGAPDALDARHAPQALDAPHAPQALAIPDGPDAFDVPGAPEGFDLPCAPEAFPAPAPARPRSSGESAAPARSPAAPAHALPRSPWRRPAIALLAAAGVALVALGISFWRDPSRPRLSRKAPSGATGTNICLVFSAAGSCDVPATYAGGVLKSSTGRFAIGRPDDVVAAGRWACGSVATLALLRPDRGEVWEFSAWPGIGEAPLRGRLVARVAQARQLGVHHLGACDALIVGRADGTSVVVDPGALAMTGGPQR